MDQKKILYLADNAPYPLDNGEAVRWWNLCYNLSANYSAHLCHFEDRSQSNISRLSDAYDSIIQIQKSEWGFEEQFWKGHYLTGINYGWAGFLTLRRIINDIKEYVKNKGIDIIHSTGVGLSSIIASYIHDVPKIIDICDSPSLHYSRRINNESSIRSIAKCSCKFILSMKKEKVLSDDFDLITCISPIDGRNLEKNSTDTPVRVVPNGVNTDIYYQDSTLGSRYDQARLVFHGNLDYEPNKAAVSYIFNSILPVLERKNLTTELVLIGSNPPPVPQTNSVNITVKGWVDDIVTILNSTDIGCYPMVSGSGMKNKILEAMAVGLPVITTNLGAESFNKAVTDRLIIRDTSEGLSSEILKLANDLDLSEEIGRKNRRAVSTHYSWKNASEKLERIYDATLSG